MSILAHNIYRLFAMDYVGYSHCDVQPVFDKFISVQGSVSIQDEAILVKLKRKRTLPFIIEQMSWFHDLSIPWLFDRPIQFVADSTS